jgi:N-methylhydantoinase B
MGGGVSRVVINPDTPDEREIRAFSDDNHWKRGDLVRIYAAAGGGWGDPLERDIDRVLDDVKDGFVSLDAALTRYGVVVDPDSLTADISGTEARRTDIRKTRGAIKLFHRFDYFSTESEELEWVNKHMPR